MLNENVFIEEEIEIEKQLNYDAVKAASKNVGSKKQPRYQAPILTPDQKLVADLLQGSETVRDMANVINEHDELDLNYNYFFIVKHLKMAIKFRTEQDKVQMNLEIVNRWLNRLS